MIKNIDIKEVVKHIVNGTLDENLCRVCLQRLDSLSENIFTTVCKGDKEYCIAEVLKEICDIKISPSDKFKICTECFISASRAYNFFLSTRRSEEILNFYVSLLEEQINVIDISDHLTSESLCMTLPLYNPETEIFDYDLSGILTENNIESKVTEYENTVNNSPLDEHDKNISDSEDNSDVVIIADENGEPTFYKAQEGSLVPINEDGRSELNEVLKRSFPNSNRMKKKRRRNPMSYIMCSKCPVRYKFVAKLKEHMKSEHDIDLFICTVCKTIVEDEEEFNRHLKTHSNIHRCAKCNSVFKNRDSIITHLKWHEEMENVTGTEKAHICEVCGLVLMDDEQLKEHNEKKHVKKYTCYYCGRMYKGQSSFETHIKKHEMHMKGGAKEQMSIMKVEGAAAAKKSKYSCDVCERSFVDERSLMWHQRLHTNERPYVCDVCGRGFVSLNRRNQHAVCAHTAPARRCPLCPALFHLRSMVNTHVKKVHLKAHKRRNRTSKHQNVFWRTEPVPIQELSVSIQNEILELQAAQKGTADGNEW